jgi:hypothetical protein
MNQKSRKLKKSLTNLLHMHILEIIGLAKKPLSAYEILKKSMNDHPLMTSRYFYEVVKELAKTQSEYLAKPHSERFLKISYKEKVYKEIEQLEKKYRLGSQKDKAGMEISSRTFSNSAEEKQIDKAMLRITNLKNKSRNWRFRLNFKGFLLYLISVHENRLDDKKLMKIKVMVRNLSQNIDTEFRFLGYFEILDKEFGDVYKVHILVELAVELQYHLQDLTLEYLRYYVIRRLYEEVSFWLGFDENIFLKPSLLAKKEWERYVRLQKYKIKLLNELITFEQKSIEDMMIKRVKTIKLLKVS